MKVVPLFTETAPACYGYCHQGDIECPTPLDCMTGKPSSEVKENLPLEFGWEAWFWFVLISMCILFIIWTIIK